jgi:hypothetical protein
MSFQSSKRALSPENAASEPSGARRKLDQPVNPQDKEVLEVCNEFPENLNISLATLLLATIVSTSTVSLNPKYEKNQNAKALLDADPDLLRALQSAWTKRLFQDIRNLRKPYPFLPFIYLPECWSSHSASHASTLPAATSRMATRTTVRHDCRVSSGSAFSLRFLIFPPDLFCRCISDGRFMGHYLRWNRR